MTTINEDKAIEHCAEAAECQESACSVDRRRARSRKALRRALVELMDERGFDNITVGDICSRADLNRGTFYNHYEDKESLLACCEEEVLHNLEQFQNHMQGVGLGSALTCRIENKPLPFLVALFDHLREDGDFLRVVLGAGGDVSFGPRLRDLVCGNFVRAVLSERYRSDESAFVDYYVAFFASAYLGVIMRWIERGMEESSEEMALIAMKLLFMQPGEPICM